MEDFGLFDSPHEGMRLHVREGVKGMCYSIVELETSWEKETCIHVELGNFIFFPIIVYK